MGLERRRHAPRLHRCGLVVDDGAVRWALCVVLLCGCGFTAEPGKAGDLSDGSAARSDAGGQGGEGGGGGAGGNAAQDQGITQDFGGMGGPDFAATGDASPPPPADVFVPDMPDATRDAAAPDPDAAPIPDAAAPDASSPDADAGDAAGDADAGDAADQAVDADE